MKSNPKTSPDFETFRNFVRQIVNVPGADVRRDIEREKEQRKRKKRAKTSPASRDSNDRER